MMSVTMISSWKVQINNSSNFPAFLGTQLRIFTPCLAEVFAVLLYYISCQAFCQTNTAEDSTKGRTAAKAVT